ncbi:hypothetical protein [Sphingomonas abietis]|uniref:GNAT family N-acetyltransferase n=1 Tax=Sphingomonas abietis TaxID=3012344 RepID=A0ABY7NLA9_9SPHN|nr:hypothetical protein [Sphingomonas abietis]WBO22298.1 hypothetical protein PBT88_19480 [Sphingomonas abietis]
MTAPVKDIATLGEIGIEIATIEQQIAWLDALRGDRHRYVVLLRRLMAGAGTSAVVQYDRQGRSLIIGAWDRDFNERFRHSATLVQHAKDNGLLIDLMAAVETDGFVREARSGDLRALALTIKRFLHMGGILFIDQDGRLREGGVWSGEIARNGPCALATENAARAWFTIRKLPGMDAWAERFVRLAGCRRDGIIILEKRA